MYLYWSPVGADVISGVQGRYFLPLAGLASVTLCAAIPARLRLLAPAACYAVVLGVAAEAGMTSVVVVQHYKVF
jgi:hypothetical protein